MAIASGISTICLVLLNIIFLVGGIVLFIVLAYCGSTKFIKNQTDHFLPTTAKFDGFLNRWGLKENTIRKYKTHNFADVAASLKTTFSYLNILALSLIMLGAVGLINSYGESKIWDVLVTEIIKQQVKEFINDKYKGTRYFDVNSIVINVFMAKFKCCGVTDYKDFEKAHKWNKTYTLSQNNQVFTAKAPLVCCKQDDTFPEGVPSDSSCFTDPNDMNSYAMKGCGQMIDKIANRFRDSFLVVAKVVIIIQLICILMFLYIIWKANHLQQFIVQRHKPPPSKTADIELTEAKLSHQMDSTTDERYMEKDPLLTPTHEEAEDKTNWW